MKRCKYEESFHCLIVVMPWTHYFSLIINFGTERVHEN